jgi:RHS repeat-associated protein
MNLKLTIATTALASGSLLAFSSVQAAQMKQAFSYDAAGRLISVTSDTDAAMDSLDEHYSYDRSGYITEKVVNGQTVRMTYDAGNQLMSRSDVDGSVTFSYDSAGRLVAERQNGQVIAQYEYGYLDKVTQVTRGEEVTQFHYNARGMLVAKERDGQIVETFGWDGIGLIAKDGVVYANEAHVSGGVPLAAIDTGSENAELQYFDSDYLGTTTAVYSATGEVDAKLAGSFGAGTESGEVRFTGKPYDADLDAHVFPYRNYKSEAGRWASADPAGFPDGPNQHYYACVPTMSLDPLGLYSTSVSYSHTETLGLYSLEVNFDLKFDVTAANGTSAMPTIDSALAISHLDGDLVDSSATGNLMLMTAGWGVGSEESRVFTHFDTPHANGATGKLVVEWEVPVYVDKLVQTGLIFEDIVPSRVLFATTKITATAWEY